MRFPVPVPGLVIRYAYLWRREHLEGREEGRKDRPCAVLLSVADDAGEKTVVVQPITHTRPADPADGVEIPTATKRRLGLDLEPSWIILTESNRFLWPGPDLRPAERGDAATAVYGELPKALYEEIRRRWLERYQARKARVVTRTS